MGYYNFHHYIASAYSTLKSWWWMHVDMQDLQPRASSTCIQSMRNSHLCSSNSSWKLEVLSPPQFHLGKVVQSTSQIGNMFFSFQRILPDGQTHLPWCHSCKTTQNWNSDVKCTVSPVLKCSCLAVDQNSKPSRQVASSISTTLQPALNCSLISLLLKGKILSGSLRKI